MARAEQARRLVGDGCAQPANFADLEHLSHVFYRISNTEVSGRREASERLKRFTVSWKRQTVLSLCFYAIADGKPLTLFLELL
jgi:hypothetical protein